MTKFEQQLRVLMAQHKFRSYEALGRSINVSGAIIGQIARGLIPSEALRGRLAAALKTTPKALWPEVST